MASSIRRILVVAAAAASGAMGIVALPVPAAASPCSWMLPEGLWLDQDNDIKVIIPVRNNKLVGTAQYYKGDALDQLTEGAAQGFLNADGHTFKFVMHWNKGPGAGFSNNYYGQVNDDGSITGYTENNLFTRNNFRAEQRADCAGPAPAPPPEGVPDPVH
jgi:hypothetical protein